MHKGKTTATGGKGNRIGKTLGMVAGLRPCASETIGHLPLDRCSYHEAYIGCLVCG